MSAPVAPEISPERFTWERYISHFCYSIGQVYDHTGAFCPDVEVIGFCAANRLSVRPRTLGRAVMVRFPETDETFWCHYVTVADL